MTSRWRLGVLAAGLAACGAGNADDRVVVLGLDGLDRLMVEALVEEGRLPAFARLQAEGAMADLDVSGPVLSPIVWTTMASGYPGELHGIGGWTTESGRSFTSADVRAHRLWDVASAASQPSVVSGYLMTWPASPVPGAMLSDRFAWAFPMNKDPSDPTVALARRTHEAMEALVQPAALAEGARALQPTADELAGHPLSYQLQAYSGPFHPLPRDLLHLRFWQAHWDAPAWGTGTRPRLGMMHLVLADQVSHIYWPFQDPEVQRTLRMDPEARMRSAAQDRAEATGRRAAPYSQAPITPEEVAEAARWVPDAYEALDAVLAQVMEEIDPADTTLVVVSDHGFQSSRSRPVLNGGHRVPAVLYAWGHRVRAGAEEPDGHVLDVAPTLLSLLSLPLARDFTGAPLEGLFELPPAPEPVGSWRLDGPSLDLAAGPQSPHEEALLDQLQALGYVDALGAPLLGASRHRGRQHTVHAVGE